MTSNVSNEEEEIGIEEEQRPDCQLSGENGNVFSIIGRVSKALKGASFWEKAEEFNVGALKCVNYDEVILLAYKYVNVL